MLHTDHYPTCVGKTQSDDCSKAMGALAPSTQSPKGSALPHCASRRACAVFGNVISAAHALEVTNTPGAIIDLHVEISTSSTTSYLAASDNANYLRDVNGSNTFGEINLKGNADGVGFTFTFKNRDTNAEVTIPWMQFTLFDFDMSNNGKGQEVPRPPPAPTPPHRPALMGCVTRIAVRDSLRIRGLRAVQWAGRALSRPNQGEHGQRQQRQGHMRR